MQEKSVRPADDIERVVQTYGTMIYKICFMMLCNKYDAEDALQDTILRYMSKGPVTQDKEFEKAWLIKVATNICKNMRIFKRRRNYISIEDCQTLQMTETDTGIIQDVMQLPPKYRIVILLYYIEGYSTKEISQIIHISPEAVRKRLQHAREKLRLECEKR